MNEKLIEEAAKAIQVETWEPSCRGAAEAAFRVFEKAHTTTPPDGWFYMGSHVGAPWLNLEFSEEMDETGLPLWERPVQHTPTDDEREALTYLITAFRFRERGLRGVAMEPDLAVSRPLAEFLLAEGFRHFDVPEPSTDPHVFVAPVAGTYEVTPSGLRLVKPAPEPQGEPSGIPFYDQKMRELDAIRAQGEPSDAVLDAALDAIMADPDVPTGVRPHLLGGEVLVIRERTDAEPIVRAVLRAAGGVR